MVRVEHLLASIALFAAAVPAYGATVVWNPVVNLDATGPFKTYDFQNSFYRYWFGPNPPQFALNPGDTLEGTISFQGGALATITETGFEAIQLVLGGDSGPVYFTASLAFNNVTGDYVGPDVLTSGLPGPIPGSDYQGTLFGPRNFQTNLTNSSFSFDSISYKSTYVSGPATVFKAGFFNMAGPPPPPVPVPEPATWLMMVLGFGIVGGSMRRRKGRRELSVASRESENGRCPA